MKYSKNIRHIKKNSYKRKNKFYLYKNTNKINIFYLRASSRANSS